MLDTTEKTLTPVAEPPRRAPGPPPIPLNADEDDELTLEQRTEMFGVYEESLRSIGEGEIVGFLGPNGAGKSTTMKIATCFLPPTSGEAWVGGFNVVEKPMEVKKITGYLPEHNPLYLDLYVHEYLNFIGKLYGLRSKSLKHRVKEMVDLCGLSREQNKKIQTLSKYVNSMT